MYGFYCSAHTIAFLLVSLMTYFVLMKSLSSSVTLTLRSEMSTNEKTAHKTEARKGGGREVMVGG